MPLSIPCKKTAIGFNRISFKGGTMKKDQEFSGDDAFVVSQYGKEKEYWLNKLSGELVKSFFPYDHTGRGGAPDSLGEVKIPFPADLPAALVRLGTGKDHRVHMVLAAAVSLLLERYTGSSDIILGIPIYKQEKQGRFINTAVALRQYLPREGDMTFKELLLQTRQTVMEAIEHQNYPLDILVYQLDLSAGGDEFPLFDVAVLLENIHDKKYIEHLNCSMVFSFSRSGETLEGSLEYNPHRYEKTTAERIAGHFIRLLSAALAGIDGPLSALEILTPEEKNHLLYQLNDTAVDYPRDKTLARLFTDQVDERPDHLAIIDLWQGSPESCKGPLYLTYRELSRDVDRLTYLLKEKGVKPDRIVVLMEREPLRLITGILAVISAGGAYMPLDPDYPPERMQLMLKDSSARVLVTTTTLAEKVDRLGGYEIEKIFLDGGTEHYPISAFSAVQPSSLAYVLYTSGSTGVPKGVMVSNRNVVRLVKNNDFVEFSENTRLLQNGSPVFDALTFELWGTLLNGGQLVLAEKEYILDAGKLGDAIKRYRLNAMLLTTVFFNQLVQQDSGMFGSLEWLLVGGEALSPRFINQARQASPGLRMKNAYGPTENGVISTSYLIDRDFEVSIPIGRPINNTTAYIFDACYRLQPVGVGGELVVGGDGVARGYMNNPELTAEKFVCYRSYRTYIFYRTGDLARWLPDGNIEFLSRRDFQVKIRGHRIEPGEIENRVLKYRDIKDVVVVLSGDRETPVLCAYFVSDSEVTERELKDYLGESLPDYMVPGYFVRLEKLPCTPSGKIDRKALPDPKTLVTEKKAYQPPTNDAEAAVLQTWAEVLELDPGKIDIEDNFFELGGNSINILKVQNQLRNHFNCEISMSTLFLYPTIKELAADIMKKSPEKKLEFVVKLNKGGNKKNIFIFHPLNGMIYPYKELARLLEDRFNVYGVQAKGLTREEPLPPDYNEMLKEYMAEIRTVQEKGPYIFAGYCVGCALAYDAAAEMEDLGEEVEAVILLDVGIFWPRERKSRLYFLRLSFERKLFALHVARTEIKSEHLDESENEEQKRLIERVEENNINILRRRYIYRRVIRSPLIHVRAKKNLSLLLFQGAWRKMSTGRVKLCKISGDHFNMFMSPHVEQMAEVFDANLES
jgi:amino acid adenylation domain-containing protein